MAVRRHILGESVGGWEWSGEDWINDICMFRLKMLLQGKAFFPVN